MELLNAAGRPQPFSITFATADQSRDTGGEVIHYPKAILSRLRRSGRPGKPGKPGKLKSGIQYHANNRTRNICALGPGRARHYW